MVQSLDQLAPDRKLAGIAFNLVNEAKTRAMAVIPITRAITTAAIISSRWAMMKHASLGARVGALVLASICLATAGYGVVYAAFALDYDTLEAARTGNRPVEAMGFWRRPPDVKPVLSPWADRAGMGGAARRRIALDSDTPQDAAERLVDVTKALQQEPTSGWLCLSIRLSVSSFPSVVIKPPQPMR